MNLDTARFAAVLLTGLYMVPALAHAMELPHKIGMAGPDYLVVQQIYRGWSLSGVVAVAALAATAALAAIVRRRRRAFRLALASFLCLAGALAVFFAFTYPVNQATANWTMLPDGWQALRARWEYAHAGGAMLNLAAFAAAIGAAVASPARLAA
ncbi:MAG: hypothetical protein AB7K86_13860 [Rhodospirillales bacterium]